MNADQMTDLVLRAKRQLGIVEDAIFQEDWIGACRALGNITEMLPAVASECAERSLLAGATQKKVATALGLPPSALAGWKAAAERRRA